MGGMRGAIVGLLLALTSPASAQEGGEAVARAHFVLGQAAYEEGRFATALKEFEEAYRASKRAALLYNIGMCHEKLGRFPQAVDHFQRYLTEVPAAPDLASVEERVRGLKLRIEESATLDTPRAEPPVVAPPPVAVTVSAPSAPSPRPIYRRGWFWGVVGGVVVVGAGLGVGLGVGLSGGGSGFQPNLPVGGPGAL